MRAAQDLGHPTQHSHQHSAEPETYKEKPQFCGSEYSMAASTLQRLTLPRMRKTSSKSVHLRGIPPRRSSLRKKDLQPASPARRLSRRCAKQVLPRWA